MRRTLLAAWIGLTVLACSSTTPEPAREDGQSVGTADTADASSSGGAAPAASGQPSADATTSTGARQREIMRKDCQELARKYGDLVRAEEAAKLSPKLTPAQRQTAESNIDKGAQQLSDRFAEGCDKSLVGKFADESALFCAMSAKSIAAFDTCMNGPVQPAP
jgi:hypothetical protein